MSEICSPDVPLSGELDVERHVAVMESGFTVKGTFFEDLRERLGDEWATLRETLDAAPRFGRYVPFSDYPLEDYMRLVAAVARARHPGVSVREGFRRTARDDFALFAQTTLGKIVLAAVGDPKSAMLAMSSIYVKMAPGSWHVEVRELDDRTVRVRWENIPGIWEYQLGQVEGLCGSFGASPTIVVTELAPRRIQFDVTLS